MEKESFIPILFNVLFGFVILNMLVNFILLYVRRQKINKMLALYWPGMLFFYLVMGAAQQGELNISLAYSTAIIGGLVNAAIGFEAIGRKFKWKTYLLAALPLYPLTYWLHTQGFGFTIAALPFAILAALPFMHAFVYMNIIDAYKTTRLQKLLGIVYVAHAIHSLNFAFFRMDEGAQLWGWLVSYALCDFLAVLLPSASLEMYTLSEKERLQKLVDERTAELRESLKTNENLFKILIHDIGNPLMVIKGNLFVHSQGRDDTRAIMGRIQKSSNTIEEIIEQVKFVYKHRNSDKLPLKPVSIEDCFKEITFIFEQPLKQKNISLNFRNELSPRTMVMADQTSLTHSVLSNLISNGLKFTAPHTTIEVVAREKDHNVIIEVKDEGPGISRSIIDKVMSEKELNSSFGTLGEAGNGLGLSIVKSIVESYGGEIEFDSSLLYAQKQDFGTNVRITLDRA